MENHEFGFPSGIGLVDTRFHMLDSLIELVRLLCLRKINYVAYDFTFDRVTFQVSLTVSGDHVDIQLNANNVALPSSIYEQAMNLQPGVKPTLSDVWHFVCEDSQLKYSMRFRTFHATCQIDNIRINRRIN